MGVEFGWSMIAKGFCSWRYKSLRDHEKHARAAPADTLYGGNSGAQ
jgi:hypothetical protein